MDAGLLPHGHPRAGFFGHERTIRFQDVADRAARTLVAIETASANGPWVAGGFATFAASMPAIGLI